ncbi:hypothetical protein RM704_10695 [Streptomyces sp. DSM 3412]|uniref:Uncharacterized protein n=1 Tax=Streptomyces gottesmaniae TaxID=3075518 RepID=A0ABU2YVK9_9ACTN|nr:hypothetical protein [Streptomyces sp. DSM 3412]MDT0567933.1 hypothetical protein [Streptomyces sp. DSM 3412]
MTAYKPQIGDTVEDTGRARFGRVMGFEGPYVQLRPISGGREWDADPEHIRQATLSEALRADVKVANARSRGERP